MPNPRHQRPTVSTLDRPPVPARVVALVVGITYSPGPGTLNSTVRKLASHGTTVAAAGMLTDSRLPTGPSPAWEWEFSVNRIKILGAGTKGGNRHNDLPTHPGTVLPAMPEATPSPGPPAATQRQSRVTAPSLPGANPRTAPGRRGIAKVAEPGGAVPGQVSTHLLQPSQHNDHPLIGVFVQLRRLPTTHTEAPVPARDEAWAPAQSSLRRQHKPDKRHGMEAQQHERET